MSAQLIVTVQRRVLRKSRVSLQFQHVEPGRAQPMRNLRFHIFGNAQQQAFARENWNRAAFGAIMVRRDFLSFPKDSLQLRRALERRVSGSVFFLQRPQNSLRPSLLFFGAISVVKFHPVMPTLRADLAYVL